MTTALFTILILGADPTPVVEPDPSRNAIREALVLYGWGVVQQRHDRLIEAARILEESIRIEADAVLPRKMLVQLYHALGRPDDAARIAGTIVALEPGHVDTWRTLARLLHDMNRTADGIVVLNRCAATPQVVAQPMELVGVFRDQAELYASIGANPQAAEALTKSLRIFGAFPQAALAKLGDQKSVDLMQGQLAEALAKASVAASHFGAARDASLEARDAFRKADSVDRAAAMTPVLAAAYAGLGDTSKAHDLLDEFLVSEPRDVGAYRLKARLWRQAGDTAAVLRLLTRAVDAHPDHVPLRVLLGDEYRVGGERDLAAQAYRAAIERRADVAAYRGIFAILSGPGGSPAKMLEIVDQSAQRSDGNDQSSASAAHARAITEALRLEPAAAGLLVSSAVGEIGSEIRQVAVAPKRKFETWCILGGVAEKAGQVKSAESLYRAALAVANAEQQVTAASALLRILWAAKNREEIVAVCQNALASNTIPADFYHDHLALALMQLGRTNQALAHADQAVALAAKSRQILLRLHRADLLRFAERFEAAEAECKSLLKDKLPPDDERRIRLTLARIYGTTRSFEHGEEQLRRLLELDPADAAVHNDLGYLLADQGQRLEEAERFVRRAMELDRVRKSDSLERGGANAAYLDSLGLVYLRRGRVAESKVVLEQAAQLPSGAADPNVWNHLGDACARLDQPNEAVAAWQHARDLLKTEKRSINDPRGGEIDQKLKRIKTRD